MSTQTWQAPIHFDTSDMAPVTDNKDAINETSSSTDSPPAVVTVVVADTPVDDIKPNKAAEITPDFIAPKLFNVDTLSNNQQAQVSFQAAVQIPPEQLNQNPIDPHLFQQQTHNPNHETAFSYNQTNFAHPAKQFAKSLGKATWQQSQQIIRQLQAQDFPLWTWFFSSLAGFFVLFTIVDTWLFIEQQFSSSFLLGSAFLMLFATILLMMSQLIMRSWTEIRQIRQISHWQKQGDSLRQHAAYGHALPYITQLAQLYQQREDMQPNLESFFATANSSHTDTEICKIFSQQVLHPVDQRAYELVSRHAGQTALLVVLSPIPLLSGIMTLWRNLILIRDISCLYGGRPGFFSASRLFVTVIQNLIYADVSEMVAESMSETLGSSVLSVLSTQVAQGIGSSMMTARVGIQAMKSCRPLSFEEDERPRLSDIRKQTLSLLKQKLGGKSK